MFPKQNNYNVKRILQVFLLQKYICFFWQKNLEKFWLKKCEREIWERGQFLIMNASSLINYQNSSSIHSKKNSHSSFLPLSKIFLKILSFFLSFFLLFKIFLKILSFFLSFFFLNLFKHSFFLPFFLPFFRFRHILHPH